uniref:Uncharacterized protein n=1 Tax=Musa acuminata subsp. malaccensis TaxID=214687 RepID=A0A804K824_MUSAM
MRGPLNLYNIHKFRFIVNISLDAECTYTTKTYILIKICPKSFSFPLPQPNLNI